jgi:hypothetical protein
VVQFSILSGKLAGTQWVARRLPFWVGRAAPAALLLEEAGVWDRHFQIALHLPHGVILSASTEALTRVNGQRIEEEVLKNGDLVEAGAVQMRFGLSPTRQRGLRFREAVTWLALAAACLGQVALIYWLLE